MWHELEPGEMHAGFWLGDLRKTNQLENLGVDGRIILKCILKDRFGLRIGLMWL